jgi:hypothetical protein
MVAAPIRRGVGDWSTMRTSRPSQRAVRHPTSSLPVAATATAVWPSVASIFSYQSRMSYSSSATAIRRARMARSS